MAPRPLRAPLAAAALALLLSTGVVCDPSGLRQGYTSIPGVVEPNTPGAPGVPVSAKLQTLLGPNANLNRVHYVRTLNVSQSVPVDVVVVLVPGYLGGATTFDSIARDLVTAVGPRMEVWAIDRRPNQLEDQLGALHAYVGSENHDLDAIREGAQFYFADTDAAPLGDFPGPGDLDIEQDGAFDAQTPLVDAFGVSRLPVIFEQDDVRFLANWGIDLYMRDWKLLIEKARQVVGEDGLVLLGGHSQGTSWATLFAAYDFDPGPGVQAGHDLVDGLILLEGPGIRPPPCTPSGTPPPPATATDYLAEVAALAEPGGPDNFQRDLVIGGQPVLKLTDLGTVGQVASIAAYYDPDSPSLIQRTPVFGSSLLGLLLSSPATNQAIAGMFIDDDFSLNVAFRAGMGFTDDGPNYYALGVYRATPSTSGPLRTWKDFDDPTLPVCPPHARDENLIGGVGCAIDLTANPGDREVSSIDTFLRTQFEVNNGFEWYFLSGRVSLDFRFCNDSSALGDESLLAITQNANVDVPVLGIGGGNGLTPTTASYGTYFDSIATLPGDKRAFVLPGYAHLDPLTAKTNEAVPLIVEFIDRLEAGASPVFP
jgi:pimeloyl-ACP methyl ester carboxylesterase